MASIKYVLCKSLPCPDDGPAGPDICGCGCGPGGQAPNPAPGSGCETAPSPGGTGVGAVTAHYPTGGRGGARPTATVCRPKPGPGTNTSISSSSSGPIKYWTGAIVLREIDLTVPNSTLFGHRRFYNNVTTSQGPNGFNWYVTQLPFVVDDGTSRAVIFEPNNPVWFDISGGSYVQRYAQPNYSLVENTGNNTLVFTNTNNGQTEITVFNDTDATVEPGRFVQHTDARGVVTTIAAETSGRIDELQRTYTISGTTHYESLLYSYFASGDSVDKIQYVTFRRKVGAGAWTDLKRVAYAYYDGTGGNGLLNDLMTATQQAPDGSGGWNDVAVSYYRYYATISSTSMAHGLKMKFGPEAWRRMLAASINPLTATDNTIKPYADNYFEYGLDGAVTKEIAAVCPSCPGGGTTTDEFEITHNPNNPDPEYNNWETKNVQTLPDGAEQIVYSNYAGLPMLKVYKASNGTDKWYTFFRYHEDYPIVIWTAQSAAVNGYNDTYDDLLNYNTGTSKYQYLNDSAGLITVTEYFSSTNIGSGQVKNHVSAVKIRQGQTGSDVLTRSYTYTSRMDSNGNTIYPVATMVDYPDASNSAVTITTSYSYTWHSGTTQMATRTTTLPVVSTAHNGSNSASTIVETFDIYGNRTQLVDERGITNSYTYDVALGVMTQQVLNVSGSSGPGLNVTTDYTYDTDGRLVQELGPSHTSEISGSATTVRTAIWYVYKKATQPSSGTGNLDEMWIGQGYATGSSPSYTYTLTGPVLIARTDKNGRGVDQISSARTSGSGKLSASDTFAQTDWKSWSSIQYDNQGRTTSSRVYHAIPSSGTGSFGTNYSQTDYGYDALERRNMVKVAGGTITRTVWTAPQRVLSIWIGTDDTGATNSDPDGSGSPNNMVKVSENQYDGGSAGGDGNVTQVTLYADGSDTRVTSYGYDFRDRQTSVDGELDQYEQYTYDNLGRLTKIDRKNTSSGGNLIGRSETKYDDRGRVYQQITYAVDPSTGTAGNALISNSWYDASGNLLQQIDAGDGIVFSKKTYNGAGWVTASYRGYNSSGTSFSQAGTVANDIVMQQSENTYNDAGEVISTASYQRLNDAPSSSTGSAGALTTVSNPKGRASYVAIYYDGIGRRISTANYGAISSFTRPSTTPTRSDTILVTSTDFDSAGRAYSVVDPRAIETRTTFDAAGRTTNTKEAYGTGDERETQYTYTLDNQIASLIAVNATTGNQTTTYTYGSTLTESDVADNGLLRFVAYPDSSGSGDRVKYTYNRLGQQKTMEDQRGTIHTYGYDKLGRLLHDRITTVGSNTDNTILRISHTYEVRGMLEKVTSYDNATVGSGTAQNEVKLEYNTFSQLSKEWQDHSGTVGGTEPNVQYAYATGGSSSNQIRPTSITYPNARQIDYNYGTSSGMNDYLNRLEAIKDSSSTLAAYTYLGAGMVVRIDYQQPDVMLDLWGGTTATFDGLDRFNRIVDQRWVSYASGTTDLDRYKYWYDRNSNRTAKENTVSKSIGSPVYLDEYYTYDNLNRLTNMKRGQLTGGPPPTGISGTPGKEQGWTLDKAGNWSGYVTKTTGTTDLNQTRTSNVVNEITAISETVGTSWPDPTYDAAGNMITMPQPNSLGSSYTVVYDAWNRLVKTSASSVTVAEYQYDGRGRRIVKLVYTGGSLSETRHLYYSNGWQILEERVGSSTSADLQYVWGRRYVDELICRDASSTQLYALQDANFNVTTIADDSGAVQERYAFYGYGERQSYDPLWAPSSSSFGWYISYQGLLANPESGLIGNRRRHVHPALGVFSHRDSKYWDGSNLYWYERANPANLLDPLGMQATRPTTAPGTQPTSRPEPRSREKCCQDAEREGKNLGHGGGGLCCDGRAVPCSWRNFRDPEADPLIESCALEHEEYHISLYTNCPDECPYLERTTYSPNVARSKDAIRIEECTAGKIEINCLARKQNECKTDKCKQSLQEVIELLKNENKRLYDCDLTRWLLPGEIPDF